MKSDFVIAAYVFFTLALLWDFVAPKQQLRRVYRHIQTLARREKNRS